MKLVFLHGAGSSSLSYYYQLRHFRNSKAIDLPGHSTGTPCPNIDSYLEWVRGFVTARRYKDVVLCGHGMGGAITLLYALRYPEELKGIILMGTGARPYVNPDKMERCRQPGPENSEWLADYMESFAGVAPDMHPVLSQRAVELGPEVQLNDLLACDGFVLAATHMPGAYEDFVNLVVPELQRRGLFREEYANGSLRDNLGFARP